MDGLRLTGRDEGQLRDRLSLEIIRHRNLANIGNESLDVLSVRASWFARQFERLRLVASEPLALNTRSQSGGCQNNNILHTRNRVPTTYQLSVTTVDDQGHVHTSPMVTTHLQHGFRSQDLPTSVAPQNHAFLCMDVNTRVISPRFVEFLNDDIPHSNGGSVSQMLCDSDSPQSSPCDTGVLIGNTSRSSSGLVVDISYIDLGNCDQQCTHCGSLFWYNERLRKHDYRGQIEYHACCGGGDIYMRPSSDPPEIIQRLLSNSRFMDHIRAYNQMFAMTSFGAKVDHSVNRGSGPYVFKVSGQIYHWIGSFLPEKGDPPRFLQLYIYDTHNEVSNRMRAFGPDSDRDLAPEAVADLIRLLDEHNGLVQLFRTARDRCTAGDIPGFKIRLYNKGGLRGYELPTSDTLGGIVFEDSPKSRTDFDVIIEARGGPPQRINKLHESYMSLQFPLLFVFSEPGFYPELKLKPRHGRGQGKKVSMNAYYKYQLHPRVKEFGLIFRSGRLFQQYVTVFCAIEQSRLDNVRKRQSDLRADYLMGLYDAISRGDRRGIEAGSMIMLPKTFTGSPRYMYSHYLDALAICRSLGNPQYFITFTCNVKWPEIQRYMEQHRGLTPADRADIVCRLFYQKVNDFIRFLKDEKPFGGVIGFLYTIEFQKRGLPHCHTLLWVEPHAKIKEPCDIDNYIFAELPDPTRDPEAYKVVTQLMMHGPCGAANLDAPCTENGICNKNFPKKHNNATFFDVDGYTHYRRQKTSVHFMKGDSRLDNCNVVPYNRTLCLAFRAHINFEYCGWSMLIKYLFKYISKGPDRIMAKVERTLGETPDIRNQKIDEIQSYVDGRFVFAFEAC